MRKRFAAMVILLGFSVVEPGRAAEAQWESDRQVAGVTLQSRPAASGFREYRGRVTVCTDLDALERFVADPDRFDQWIPFTEAARALPDDGAGQRYYLRTATPWPMQSRDMVYLLQRYPADRAGTLHISLSGIPDALPPSDDAVRMVGADGQWTLISGDARIDVALRLSVNPGRVPKYFANRRTAATVGGMLANLRERFPCGE